MSKKKGKKGKKGKSKSKKTQGKAAQRSNARVQRAQKLKEQEQRAEENTEEEDKAQRKRGLARVRKAKELREQEQKAEEQRAEEKKAEEQEALARVQRAQELKEQERREEQEEEERRESDRRAKDRRAADRQAREALVEDAELHLPLPEPPSFWQRHDLGVLFFALAVFAGGTLVSRQLATPKQIEFAKSGLQFQRPSGWLPAQSTPAKAAGLANTTSGFGVANASSSAETGQHFVYQSPRDSRQRIEVRIGPRPPYRNLRGARAIERLGQYGEFYWEAESSDRSIARRDWVRSEFRYAFKPSKSGSPQIANAVEYATIQDARLYVVTLHGDPNSMTELDKLIAPTLRIDNAGEVNKPAAESVTP
jgi:hypothetical protein